MSSFAVRFSGLNITRAEMVHVDGVTPSVCMAYGPPQDVKRRTGLLRFMRNRAPLITFRDCLVREVIQKPTVATGTLESCYEIVDRRWKWAYRRVSGRYNYRDERGNLVKDTYKSWKDLFELVLDGLQEARRKLDLSHAPKEPMEIDWDDVTCADALRQLLTATGSVLALQTDDTVLVEAVGAGPVISRQHALTLRVWHDKTSQPVRYEVRFGPTIYQQWMACEPIGYNWPGELVPLEDVKWETDEFGEYDEYLAYGVPGHAGYQYDSAVWQSRASWPRGPMFYYRISGPAISTSTMDPEWDAEVTTITGIPDPDAYKPETRNVLADSEAYPGLDGILPLRDLLFAPLFGTAATKPGYVTRFANWYSPKPHPPKLWVISASPYSAACIPEYGNEFWLFDADDSMLQKATGIVVLPESAFRLSMGLAMRPAFVYVLCAFAVRDKNGRHLRLRYSKTVGQGEAQLTVMIERPDIFQWVCGHRHDKFMSNKDKLLNEIGPEIVDARVRELHNSRRATDITWNGLVPVNVRGNLRQVRWLSSPSRCTTSASVNSINVQYATRPESPYV